MTISCPLCSGPTGLFCRIREREYLSCGRCGGIFMAPQYHLSPAEEKERYLTHNNDVNDPGYQDFARPLSEAVAKRFSPEHSGLDFGCGTGPVISKLLNDRGYNISQYDPFFRDERALLEERYDYIACSEVIEHFREPSKEFKLLRGLLKPGGGLFCLTQRYSPEIGFEGWYYKNDPTHVFFYQEKTLEWIRENFGFRSLENRGRLTVLSA